MTEEGIFSIAALQLLSQAINDIDPWLEKKIETLEQLLAVFPDGDWEEVKAAVEHHNMLANIEKLQALFPTTEDLKDYLKTTKSRFQQSLNHQ